MKKRYKKIPAAVRAAIWYANPEADDWDQNKTQFITSILNRGTWEAVRWAFRHFGEAAFRETVAHPKRSQWFPEALNFWSQYFRIKLAPKTYERALFRLHPIGTKCQKRS